MNKVFVILAFIFLVVTCTFAIREPISLVFIIGSFLLIGYVFAKVGQKAEFNNRLSSSERKGTLRFCAVGFLVASLAANVCFLFWVNSKTPIFGDAYVERQQYEEIRDGLKKQVIAQEEEKLSRTYDAKESVKSSLKDASSAEFSDERDGKDGAICGYVNAKNSFGAYAGKTRYISISGQSSIDDGSQEFESLWGKLCN